VGTRALSVFGGVVVGQNLNSWMSSIDEKIAIPPSSSWLLSLPSSSQSVSCSREPPDESEKDPRVAASLLAALVKKLTGLVDEVVPGVKRGQLNEIAAV